MSVSIEQLLRRGPATSKEIQAATGLSQAAVSRRLKAMGQKIIKLKNGRSPSYMMTRNAFGGDDRQLLFMVDAHGNNTSIGYIRPLAHGGFYLEELPGLPSVYLGVHKNGLFDGLPYFLCDLAPQGFIGRQIAHEMADQSNFPEDPKSWTDDHIGHYLVSNGDDLPGNLKFGAQAHFRVRKKPVSHLVKDYPELADDAMDGVIPGSSVGGEQPKFTAYCKERSAHVIVKFSPRGDGPISIRWRDILITEYHAAEALHAGGYPAAETTLIESDGRLFLESRRFDRSGEYGRLSMISLQYVDAEFSGIGQDWCKAMESLFDQKLVSWQHLYDTAVLWCFGKLINNSDMHLGNLSLGVDGSVFRLLPVYDMCSMGFSPKSGELRPYTFKCPDIRSFRLNETEYSSVINDAIGMARDFWNRVSRDSRISPEFSNYLSQGNPADRLIAAEGGQMNLL